jgi:anti-sigma regulatory factor (Ser/Thr protein kinase)
MSTTSGVVAPSELHLMLTDAAPLESAGAAVRACALSKGFEAERATRLQVVVEELIRECRMREAASTTPGDVNIAVSFDGSSLEVTVVDHRLPLSAEQSRHLPSRRLLALGFADHLHIGFEGTSGNVATCRLAMASAFPDDLLHAEMLEPDAPDAPGVEQVEIDVRLMTAADADGLVQCVFRCYGYTYPNKSMYQAIAIRRQLETGSMISVVAIAPSGEVVGHVACTFDRPGDVIPEAGKMIVDPRYRGHHLAERLSLKRKEIAAERSIPGMWSETVTNHPASQRLAIERGAAEVGLLIGFSPQSMAMIGLPNQHSVRHSLLAVFTPTGPLPTATISVPGYAADQLATLAGIEREIRTESIEPARARSRIHSAVSAVAGAVEIRVQEIGRDIAEQVADVLDEYSAMTPATVHLHLPATDPAAAWAAAELERVGFVWCAWIPAFLSSGDSIRLQRVSDHPVGLETIVCARAEGEGVRDFVVAEWTRVHRGRVVEAK